MQNVEKADVMASGRLVGCLALTNRGLVAFEYSPQWIESGFSISPFSMPLKPGLYTSANSSFEYIAGVFDDCLPDGWGRLLTDRYLASIGIDYTQIFHRAPWVIFSAMADHPAVQDQRSM